MTKKRFSGLEVVGLLSIVLLGVAAVVHAVTVPNSFTAGTTARASEVNANFTALANAITTLEGQSLDSRITALESALSSLQSQMGTDQNGSEDLETAVADLQMSAGGSGGLVWKDSTGALLGYERTGGTIFHSDADGHVWAISLYNGQVLDIAHEVGTVYYTSSDCSGPAYIWGPVFGVTSTTLSARSPFTVPTDGIYHVIPDSPTIAMITSNSKDSGSGCVMQTNMINEAIPLSETVSATPITPPAGFVLPFHPEATP